MPDSASFDAIAKELLDAIKNSSRGQCRLKSATFWHKFGIKRRTQESIERVRAALQKYGVETNLANSVFGTEAKGQWITFSRSAANSSVVEPAMPQAKAAPLATQPAGARYWVWVTRPEYYLEEDGSEREELDPERGDAAGDWWTCHRDTRAGDLVLLYRSRQKRDIGYLLRAESDAYSLQDDAYAAAQGWDYGCAYRVLHKFKNPVTLSDLKNAPELQDWKALRGNFQYKAYAIASQQWRILEQMAATKDKNYRSAEVQEKQLVGATKIVSEAELEANLVAQLNLLKPFGYDLRLYQTSDGLSGRQFPCAGTGKRGWRIDLLCQDPRKNLVVIELKNVPASQDTFGQISAYISWVEDNLASGQLVKGLVISRGSDGKFAAACKKSPNISCLDMRQLGFN